MRENRKRETIFKEIEDESFSYFMKDVTPQIQKAQLNQSAIENKQEIHILLNHDETTHDTESEVKIRQRAREQRKITCKVMEII